MSTTQLYSLIVLWEVCGAPYCINVCHNHLLVYADVSNAWKFLREMKDKGGMPSKNLFTQVAGAMVRARDKLHARELLEEMKQMRINLGM